MNARDDLAQVLYGTTDNRAPWDRLPTVVQREWLGLADAALDWLKSSAALTPPP